MAEEKIYSFLSVFNWKEEYSFGLDFWSGCYSLNIPVLPNHSKSIIMTGGMLEVLNLPDEIF